MFTVYWSDKAVEDFDSNIAYLLEEWTHKAAAEFIENTEAVLTIISTMPESYPITDHQNIRKALICKQINLLYSVSKTDIVLLRFWNNAQDPKKLKP